MSGFLFHLLLRDEWERAKASGTYAPPSLSREGFIHLSLERQLVRSANKYFAGQKDVWALKLDASRLQPEIRLEPVGDDAFPHLFGALNLDAAVDAQPMRATDAGFSSPF